DFEPIDSRTDVRFASNTGGGVWVGTASYPYLEARPELPPGAVITKVTFFYRQYPAAAPLLLYFGSYDPSTGSFAYGNSSGGEAAAAPGSGALSTTSMELAAAPNLTIDPAKRFVIGAKFQSTNGFAATYDATVFELLVGAR